MRVCVVGAGLIGSFVAWKLSEKGYDVTVYEKKKRPGKNACSGLVSTRIWNFIPEKKSLIENEIKGTKIKFGKKTVHVSFKPEMLALNRRALDRFVFSLAQNSGAKIKTGSEVKRVIVSKGKRPVVISDVCEEYDFLIGCDGPFSVVRKSLGLPDPDFKLGIFTYLKKPDEKKYSCVKAFKNGFSWRVPRKKKTEIGVLSDPEDAKRIFEREFGKHSKIFSAVIPEGLRVSNHERIALCGDSSGLTKPWSGGGIIWELTAADILIKKFPDIPGFNREMKRFFGPRVFFSKLVTKIVLFSGFNLPFLLPKKTKFDPDWVF